MKFPRHKCGLILSHNRHKVFYETAKENIEKLERDSPGLLVWKNEESRKKAIETNEIWELKWYPDTPVSFYLIAAPTLAELLELANMYE